MKKGLLITVAAFVLVSESRIAVNVAELLPRPPDMR